MFNNGTQPRVASIKETGEELSQEEWSRFDAAVAELRGGKNASKHVRIDETGRPAALEANADASDQD